MSLGMESGNNAKIQAMNFQRSAFFAVCFVSASFAQDGTVPPSVVPVVPIITPAAEVDPIAVHPIFGAGVPPGEYVTLTGQQRISLFERQTFTTPNPWFRTFVSAGMAQIQGRQHSWGGGVEGFSKRYASQYATYVIRNSFLSLGAWGLGHDTRYVPAHSKKVMPRIGHAIMQNLLTVNREGKTTLHISRIVSGYGAGMIATNWQPNSKWSAQGIRAGNEQLIYGAIFNVGREFSPEVDKLIKRVFHHSK